MEVGSSWSDRGLESLFLALATRRFAPVGISKDIRALDQDLVKGVKLVVEDMSS